MALVVYIQELALVVVLEEELVQEPELASVAVRVQELVLVLVPVAALALDEVLVPEVLGRAAAFRLPSCHRIA